jgi:hypothetical protein
VGAVFFSLSLSLSLSHTHTHTLSLSLSVLKGSPGTPPRSWSVKRSKNNRIKIKQKNKKGSPGEPPRSWRGAAVCLPDSKGMPGKKKSQKKRSWRGVAVGSSLLSALLTLLGLPDSKGMPEDFYLFLFYFFVFFFRCSLGLRLTPRGMREQAVGLARVN